MKSESWIILELGAALVILALLSFFFEPRYEKGSWLIIGALVSSFNLVLGYKFGRSMPQQVGDSRAGQSSATEIHLQSPDPQLPPEPHV